MSLNITDAARYLPTANRNCKAHITLTAEGREKLEQVCEQIGLNKSMLVQYLIMTKWDEVFEDEEEK